MPNFAQAVKAEIVRLSRREVKAAVNPLRSSTIALKRTVAELRERVSELEAANRRLVALQRSVQEKELEISPEEAAKIRVTARSVRALRRKLGLTQRDFGRLIGITGQSVMLAEKKQGRLRLRSATVARLNAVRGIGRREARARLAEIDNQ